MNNIPGMKQGEVEFFLQEKKVKAICSGQIVGMEELPERVIEKLKASINRDKDVITALEEMHPENRAAQLEQYIHCRFGGMDSNADIKTCGTIQDGEYWDCPLRATCKHNGVLCKLPFINTRRIKPNEVALLQYTSTTMTNETIAEEMGISMGQFHKWKKNLYSFLKIQTKQEGTIIAMNYNMI
jgi:hypothetical protein